MDLKSIKNKLSALQTSGQKKEKVDYSKYLWKPKQEGKYQIRIIPSKLDKSNPFKEVFVHYGFSKFPVYALTNWGEKDPIVEFVKQLRTTNDKENWKLSKKLEPKMRIFAPVIIRGEEDKVNARLHVPEIRSRSTRSVAGKGATLPARDARQPRRRLPFTC